MSTFIAIALFVVFLKALVLVADLSPWFGLINKVMTAASGNLFWFLLMFFVLYFGFAGFMYFSFGPTIKVVNNITDSVLYTFALMCGSS